jgi:hypothetical protein
MQGYTKANAHFVSREYLQYLGNCSAVDPDSVLKLYLNQYELLDYLNITLNFDIILPVVLEI